MTCVRAGEVVADRYEIRRDIARGGICAVLEAEQRHLGRRVAIKVPLEAASAGGSQHQRLLQEARALELSRGPGVVDAIDAGMHAGAPYLAMEMLDGRGLDGLLAARTRLSIGAAASLAIDLAHALGCAHAAGVIHRDVKPSNIFVARNRAGGDCVKLIDFGAATIGARRDAPRLTQAGERVGTLEYMAPEQLLGEDVDARADLFALGTIFYECVAGEPPFPAGPRELLTTLLAGRAPPSLAGRTPSAPAGLDGLVRSMLARDPAQRPQSAAELVSRLASIAGTGQRAPLLDAPPAAARPDHGRKFPRAPYVAPLRVFAADGATYDGQTGDISGGGAFVLLGSPMHEGAEVMLRFGLPVQGRVVSVRAVVRWVRVARHRHAVGFEFLELAPDALADIERFVALVGTRTD